MADDPLAIAVVEALQDDPRHNFGAHRLLVQSARAVPKPSSQKEHLRIVVAPCGRTIQHRHQRCWVVPPHGATQIRKRFFCELGFVTARTYRTSQALLQRRQKHQRAQELLDCPACCQMLADIGDGAVHPTTVVRQARTNVQAGLTNNQMQTLASIGDDNYNNIERDLHLLLKHIWPVQPYYLPVTLYDQWGCIPDSKSAT